MDVTHKLQQLFDGILDRWNNDTNHLSWQQTKYVGRKKNSQHVKSFLQGHNSCLPIPKMEISVIFCNEWCQAWGTVPKAHLNPNEMVFCYQNCSDLLWKKIVPEIEENILKFETGGREFANFLRSLERFTQTVKEQINFLVW